MMSVPCNVLCLANKTRHPSTFSSLFLTTTTQLLLFFTHSLTATVAKQQQKNNNTRIQYNTTQHNTTHHNTTQHNTTQHNTTQHNTTQHTTTHHNTTQHTTTQHNTTQHNTTQHNITQHNTKCRSFVLLLADLSTLLSATAPPQLPGFLSLLAHLPGTDRSVFCLLFISLYLVRLNICSQRQRTSVWSLPSLAVIRYYLSRHEYTDNDTDATYFHILIAFYLLSSLHPL
ncbi:MAG: hypothetical protein JOS17DRAFT_71058 [Linnemannia elongata]|nr:MAG: hypothetical protein JOS17DRAFT_71058 [Linnemannia elongata]